MSMWNVEQMAKLARLQRIIGKQARRDADERKARIADKNARKQESKLRDLATEYELS